MSRTIIILIFFKVESRIKEWVKFFDSKGAHIRYSQFDIRLLLRGFSKYDPKKFICIQQALKGNIQKFVKSNSGWIKRNIVNFSNMEESAWI